LFSTIPYTYDSNIPKAVILNFTFSNSFEFIVELFSKLIFV